MDYSLGMYKSAVLALYGDNQSAVARALKISRASVNAWGEIIPETQAYRLERITRGKLKVDSAEYDRRRSRKRQIETCVGL